MTRWNLNFNDVSAVSEPMELETPSEEYGSYMIHIIILGRDTPLREFFEDLETARMRVNFIMSKIGEET